jgi:hypothetical protein
VESLVLERDLPVELSLELVEQHTGSSDKIPPPRPRSTYLNCTALAVLRLRSAVPRPACNSLASMESML